MGRSLQKLILATSLALVAVSCQKKSEDAVTATPKSLYVASGICTGGPGITTYLAATASRAVTKWSTSTGTAGGFSVFTDLNVGINVSVGTNPQALIDKGDHVLMLTENGATFSDRKIFKIMKNNPGTYVTYANDPTAFSVTPTHITRSMAQEVDGTLIFSKSLLAERLNSLGVRITKAGLNPWVNPLVATGNCFSGAGAQIQGVALMAPFTNTNQGKLIYIHTAATLAANKIGIIQRTGLTSGTAADCAGATAGGIGAIAHTNAPNLSGPITMSATGPAITSMVYIPTPAPATTSGKLLVTYSATTITSFDNNTTFNHGIVMWDITETSDTAATVNNPVILWRDESVVWAASAITYDSADNSVYVGVGGSPGVMNQTTQNFGYNVEKFTLDMATPKLTRVTTNNQPFIQGNAYTKCITALTLGE